MEIGLLLIERYVLESLVKGKMNFGQLLSQTGLPPKILLNVLNSLLERKLVLKKEEKYFIREDEIDCFLETINSEKNIRFEIKEVMESFINYYYKEKPANFAKSIFKLRKIWMTEEELAIFNSFFIKVEYFLDNIQRENKKREIFDKVNSRIVVFWGHSPYLPLVKS